MLYKNVNFEDASKEKQVYKDPNFSTSFSEFRLFFVFSLHKYSWLIFSKMAAEQEVCKLMDAKENSVRFKKN